MSGLLWGGTTAAVNHGVHKWLTKPTESYFDPQLGRKVEVRSKHSFMFIPMGWNTPIFIIVGVWMAIYGAVGASRSVELDKQFPGKPILESALKQFAKTSNGPAQGNTELIFVCQIPKLRIYRSAEAKETLRKFAMSSGQLAGTVVKNLTATNSITVAFGEERNFAGFATPLQGEGGRKHHSASLGHSKCY